jgi:integral membrane protein
VSDFDRSTLRQLDLIRFVAIADFVLLIPLLMNLVGIIHSDAMVSIIGPIHGVGFLLLLFLCARGAGEERWGWWFPIAVVVTLGPVGSLWGEHRVRRELPAKG